MNLMPLTMWLRINPSQPNSKKRRLYVLCTHIKHGPWPESRLRHGYTGILAKSVDGNLALLEA
jgi:hypothetical protein